MYRVSIVTDDVLDAVREQIQRAPTRFQKQLQRVPHSAPARAMIIDLSTEPGRPRRHLRWKSARQRRKVMAMLRQAGTIPYVRTHVLARGWRMELESLMTGEGVFRVVNPSPVAQYVQGDWAQPYHLDTGWPQAAPIIMRYEDDIIDQVIDVWYEATESG